MLMLVFEVNDGEYANIPKSNKKSVLVQILYWMRKKQFYY